MSDCEKCWDTPCECGWEYRNWSKDRLIAMRDMFQKLIDGTHKYSEGAKNTEQQLEPDWRRLSKCYMDTTQ